VNRDKKQEESTEEQKLGLHRHLGKTISWLWPLRQIQHSTPKIAAGLGAGEIIDLLKEKTVETEGPAHSIVRNSREKRRVCGKKYTLGKVNRWP
jgi:hypothetical protein